MGPGGTRRGDRRRPALPGSLDAPTRASVIKRYTAVHERDRYAAGNEHKAHPDEESLHRRSDHRTTGHPQHGADADTYPDSHPDGYGDTEANPGAEPFADPDQTVGNIVPVGDITFAGAISQRIAVIRQSPDDSLGVGGR